MKMYLIFGIIFQLEILRVFFTSQSSYDHFAWNCQLIALEGLFAMSYVEEL